MANYAFWYIRKETYNISMVNNMKELILDYSKWRCGDFGDHQLGEGETMMLNHEGYSCCLGQFTPQLNDNIIDEDLLDQGDPNEVVNGIEFLQNKVEDIPLLTIDQGKNTYFALDAMGINDDSFTTPDEKIGKLQELFSTVGYTIKVINEPQ